MKLIIHLGYPKTASTFLNRNLFSKHSQINLITKNVEINTYIKSIKYLDDIDYNKEKLRIKKFFISKISGEKINIFSDEMFLVPLGYRLYDNKKAIKRLYEIFSNIEKIKDIKFLLMIRNPKDLFSSYYTDEYHRIVSYDKKLDKFDKFLNEESFQNNFFSKMIIEIFDFKNISLFLNSLNVYKTQKNVSFFLLEELKNDIISFSKKLSSFLEINLTETVSLITNKTAINVTSKNKDFYYRKYDWNIFFSKYNFFYKFLPTKLIRYVKNKDFLNFCWFFKPMIIVQLNDKQKKIIESIYLKNLQDIEKDFNLNLKNNNYYN